MPSDDRVTRALAALASARDAYRSVVVAAAEEVRAWRATRSPDDAAGNGGGDIAALFGRAGLGPFAAGRLDVARFQSLFAAGTLLDAATLERVAAAAAVLDAFASLDEAAFHVDVLTGADLGDAVEDALANFGRPFAAARVVALARAGRPAEDDGALHDGFAFARWNRAERRIAPPLVVTVDGADLRVGPLAGVLDGAQKVVLVVRGAAPPAALVRLVTPDVFVMQSADAADLDRLAAFEGPGVAALVPASAAVFTHDPSADPRLAAPRLPEEAPGRALGRSGVFQQAQELAQLRSLVAAAAVGSPAVAAASAGVAAPPVAPVDRLAAWLLRHADLEVAD